MTKIDYQPTIGIEVHAQLKTKTKLFSRSSNLALTKDPNSIVSPIDAAHPGTLPALNYQAVKKVIQVGLAIDSEVANYTEWDRKNYFYPDIPKAYQISQYKYPLITGGELADVSITRIHLEEDTGKSLHDEGDYSLVDLNRAGMPLLELVTEPVVHSAAQAAEFGRELQMLLRYLDVSEANLEKGEMRIEANVSVSNNEKLGTKTEVKNLNSFKSVEQAINFEIQRQIELLEKGEPVVQETRGWDEDKGLTFSQRAKEDAHDYRYFPDPDIPKLYVNEVFDLDQMQAELPELPAVSRQKLANLSLAKLQIELLLSEPALYLAFSNLVENYPQVEPTKIANFITTNVIGALTESNKPLKNITDYVDQIGEITSLLSRDAISSTGGDTLLKELIVNDNKSSVEDLVNTLSLSQSSDRGEITALAKAIIADFPDQVADYQAGNENILKFLMGQGMKRSKGQVNPKILTKVIQDEIR